MINYKKTINSFQALLIIILILVISAVFLICCDQDDGVNPARLKAALVGSQINAVLSLSPQSKNLSVNESFVLEVRVNTRGQQVVVAGAYLEYDPQYFEVTSIDTSGSIFAGGFEIKKYDNVLGKIELVKALPAPGINSAAGLVGKINFKALKAVNPSVDNIKFIFSGAYASGDSNVIVVGDEGKDILSGVENGKYVVGDFTPPNNVSGFTAVSGDRKITLSWANPVSDFTGVKIMRKTGSNPSSPTDGTNIYDGNGISFIDTGLTNGTRYYYAAFSHDSVPNYSVGVSVNTAPDDVTAPAAINNLAAANPSFVSIDLSWTAQGDDGNSGTATSYDIRYGTTLITDANWSTSNTVFGEPSPLSTGSNQNMTISGLTSGIIYYFAIKTLDEKSNVSPLSNVVSKKTLSSADIGFRIKIDPEGRSSNKLVGLSVNTIIYKTGQSTVYFQGNDTTLSDGSITNTKTINSADYSVSGWDIKVSIPYYLDKKVYNKVLFLSAETSVTISLLAGNLQDDDNVINELDWSLMGSKWFTGDTRADINTDSVVNSLDWSYMEKNWGLAGD